MRAKSEIPELSIATPQFKKEETAMKTRLLLLIGLVIAAFSLLATNGKVRASDDTRFKWSINSASALAVDNSSITLTGAGTFSPDDPDEVTGGGTWAVSTGAGGTFQVKQLIRVDFTESVPGSNLRGGLVLFRVTYSDGSRGILAVSCAFPGTHDNVAEGSTASKGFVDYFNLQESHTPPFQPLSEQ
jgi:hypothetical protein